MSLRKITAALAALALSATGCAATGGAPQTQTQTITIRLAESFPEKHVIAKNVSQKYMANVEKASGGRIKFEYFPGEQLGKAADILDLVEGGMADIGYVGPQYASEQLPLGGVAGLPGLYPDAAAGGPAYYELVTGSLYDAEIKRHHITPLVSFVTGEYQVFSKAKIASPADMPGLRLRTSGGYMDMTADEFGAVPVSMPGPEMYQAMQRGTIDSTMLSAESVKPYGLDEVVKYATTNLSLGGFGAFYAINDEKWRTIPPDLRKIMVDEGRKVSIDSGQALLAEKQKALKNFTAKGISLTTLSPADKAKFDHVSGEVQRAWAADMNERGLPGDKILADMRRYVNGSAS